jgi:hypothetical protein
MTSYWPVTLDVDLAPHSNKDPHPSFSESVPSKSTEHNDIHSPEGIYLTSFCKGVSQHSLNTGNDNLCLLVTFHSVTKP